MRITRKSKVYPSVIRPFKTGDQAALWLGKIVAQGTIVKLYVSYARQPYAIIDLGNQEFRHYPLWQLIPMGLTRFTLHHLFYEFTILWEKLRNWRRKPRK